MLISDWLQSSSSGGSKEAIDDAFPQAAAVLLHGWGSKDGMPVPQRTFWKRKPQKNNRPGLSFPIGVLYFNRKTTRMAWATKVTHINQASSLVSTRLLTYPIHFPKVSIFSLIKTLIWNWLFPPVLLDMIKHSETQKVNVKKKTHHFIPTWFPTVLAIFLLLW